MNNIKTQIEKSEATDLKSRSVLSIHGEQNIERDGRGLPGVQIRNLGLLCLGLLAWSVSARAQSYVFSFLPPNDPNVSMTPYAINNNGDVVGTANGPIYDTAAFRYSGGTTTFLPGPGGLKQAEGWAINSNGTMVGYGDVPGDRSHAIYANPGGSTIDMHPGLPNSFSQAYAINDTNYVIGYLDSEPFIGHTGGWYLRLGSTLGANFVPAGLNNQYVMIGNGPFGGEVYNALTGEITYLGGYLGNFNNKALAINDSGMIAGLVGTQGYIYSGGVVTTFGAGLASVTGMNAKGDVVGNSTTDHAFVYLRSSNHFLDLNSVLPGAIYAVWRIVSAGGINDHGAICGTARRPAAPGETIWGPYVYRAFELTPAIKLPRPVLLP